MLSSERTIDVLRRRYSVSLGREPEDDARAWLRRRHQALELLIDHMDASQPVHFYGAGDADALRWSVYQ